MLRKYLTKISVSNPRAKTLKDIAFFIPSLQAGGAEKRMITLANKFADDGLDVDLIYFGKPNELISLVNKKVRHNNIGPQNNYIARIRKLPRLIAIIKMIAYLRRERPKALLCNLNEANIIGVIARLLACVRTNVVVTQAYILETSDTTDIFSLRRYMTWAFNRADGVLAISTKVAESVSKHLLIDKRKISVINNPVDIKSIVYKSLEPIKHPFFDCLECKIILGVGRLEEIKDFSNLIHAFEIFQRSRPARLIILGEGSQKNFLKNLIASLGLQNKVDLFGFVLNPYPWMKRADAFVLSSRSEGFSNVLIEAMACGTPVISTDNVGAATDLLEDGKWGAIVPHSDSNALASALEKTLASNHSTDVFLRASQFDIDIIKNKYHQLLFSK